MCYDISMPHLSKKEINSKKQSKIDEAFIKVFMKVKKIDQELFLIEFLTETEKKMLTKRLALIIMLVRGFSYKQIEQTLCMSKSTIFEYQNKLSKGEFSVIEKLLNKKIKDGDIWETTILGLWGILPSYGRNRWKFLDKDRIGD